MGPLSLVLLLLCLGGLGCGGGGSELPVDPGPTLENSRILVRLEPDAILASGAEAVRSGEIPSLMQVAVDTSGGLTVTAVSVDLTTIGGSATKALFDDGTHGDQAAGDGIWTARIASTASLPGLVSLPVRVDLSDGRYGIKTHDTSLVLWEREEILWATEDGYAHTDVTVNSTGTVLIAYQTAARELGLFTLPAGGSSWTQEIIDPFVACGTTPSIVVDGDDLPTVAYRHVSQDQFRLARNTGSGWPRLDPQYLLQSAPGGYAARVALDGNGLAICAWWTSTDVMVAREATAFTTESIATVAAASDGFLALAVWPSGSFTVAWAREDLLAVQARTWNGSSWGAVETVEGSLPGYGLSGVAAADGRAYLGYTLNTLNPSVVRMATRSITGSWSRSDVLADTSLHGVSAIALDRADRPHLFVAHGQRTGPLSFIYALYHAVRSDTGWAYTRVQGTSSPPKRIGMAFDPQGRPHVSFHDGLSGPFRIVHGTWQ